jgi:hypothetical protein
VIRLSNAKSCRIIFGAVLGAAMLTGTETVKVMAKPSTDGSFTTAQTNGMDRRQDRRGGRQDCRVQAGAVGKNKRDCKQEGRQQRAS